MEGVVEKHADVAPDGKSLLSATQVRALLCAAWRRACALG
jgi:hypothetical protein